MKKVILPLALFVASLSSTAYSAPTFISESVNNRIYADVDTVYDNLSYKAYNKMFGSGRNFSEEMRLQTMYEYSYNMALQASIRGNMAQINRDIQRVARDLDAIYNFEPLMIHGKVVPPVITEANDIYNQDNPLQIRLTDKIYNITSQARFSSTAPNWRNYLSFPNEQNAFLDQLFTMDTLKPTNSKERAVWERASKEGWTSGRVQSLRILEDAMNRLNRDYIGMIKFHQLVFEGRIDMPAVRGYDLYNTNEGQRLLLGEKLFQIERLPTFNTPDITAAYEMKLGWTKKTHLQDVLGKSVDKPTVLEEDYNNMTIRMNAELIANDKPIVNKEPDINNLIHSDNLKITITRYDNVNINGVDSTQLPKEYSVNPPANTLDGVESAKPKAVSQIKNPTLKDAVPVKDKK